jgi:hypothetical protein
MIGCGENLDGEKQPRHHPQVGESVTKFIGQFVSSLGVLHIIKIEKDVVYSNCEDEICEL